MSDRFVNDPLEAVNAGVVLEFRLISLDKDRRRLGRSRKTQNSPSAAEDKPKAPARQSAASRSMDAHNAAGSRSRPSSPGPAKNPRPPRTRDDDGEMYNPFAEAFKNRGGKK
jgi:uncharacterized protein